MNVSNVVRLSVGMDSRITHHLDWNATRAAKVAGYSEDTAGSIGNENLTKPEIKAYIEQLQSDLEKIAGISRLRVLKEHEKLAFSSIAHLHNTWITRKEFETLTQEQKDSIAEISTQTRKVIDFTIDPSEKDGVAVEVEFVKIKLYDKQKSLDSISKMLGYDAAKTININTPEKKKFIIGGQEIEF